MKKKYLILFLLMTQIYQAYSQNKLGKSFQLDVTLQNFLNVGMFDNFFDKEFLEVQENSYFSPSMDVSFLLTQDKWNFGLGASGLGVRKSISINWIDANSSALNREVDGIYDFEQWRLGVHVLAAYKIRSFEIGVKFAVNGLVSPRVPSYDLEFVSLWGMQEGNNLLELNSVEVTKRMIGTSIRQATTRLDCFYMFNDRWGVGLNATIWSALNPNDYDNFRMQLTYSKESDLEPSIKPTVIGDFKVNNPTWQLGAAIRIQLSKLKIPGHAGENGE
jgi:hypothetical protein